MQIYRFLCTVIVLTVSAKSAAQNGAPAADGVQTPQTQFDYESFNSDSEDSQDYFLEDMTRAPEKDLNPCVIPAIRNGAVGYYEKVDQNQEYYRFIQFQVNKTLQHGEAAILLCNEGFAPQESSKTSGSSSEAVTCENGKWSKSLVCRSVLCLGDPPPMDNGYPVIGHRSHGTVIFYVCNENHVKTQTGMVECYYGTWKGHAPVCSDGRCYTSQLNYPGLAKYSMEFVAHGHYVRVICTEGYRPFRNSMRLACNMGSWKVLQKPCVEIETSSNFVVTSKVTAQTTSTMRPISRSKNISAILSSDTTPNPPTADSPSPTQQKDCFCTYSHRDRNLQAVVNGRIVLYGIKLKKGETALLRCSNSTMNLVWQNGTCATKSSNLTCDVCLKWRASDVPSCQVSHIDPDIRCTRFPAEVVIHLLADYEDTDTRVGSRVAFSCRKNDQKLNGTSVLICLRSGEWSSPPPQCMDSCVLPPISDGWAGHYETIRLQWPVRHQRFVEFQAGKIFKHGETISFRCNRGFTPVESSTLDDPNFMEEIICENGKWSKPLQCISDHCSDPPPAIIHGQPVNFTNEHNDDEVQFICDRGFELKGRSTIRCLHGVWTGEAPECVKATACGPPENPENGKVTYSSLQFGSKLTVQCDDGYLLQQTEPVYCGSDGTWNMTDVKCVAAFCSPPKDPKNGKASYTSLKFGTELTFECDNGYLLQQTKPVHCTSNGTWSRSDVICIVYCDPPENPENGDVSYTSLKFGTELKFECDDGYRLQQINPVYCTSDGTWSKGDVTCAAKTCDRPEHPENGQVIFGSLEFGSQVKFKCNNGYVLKAEGPVYCTLDGTWSRTDVQCVSEKAKTCDRPVHPENGQVAFSSLNFRSQLMFKCDEGYVLKAKEPVYCTEEGTWSTTDVRCVAKFCDHPQHPENGQVAFSSLSSGSQLMFKCDDGYVLKPEEPVYCTEDGTWNSTDVRCDAISDTTCEIPKHPEDGQVSFTSLQLGSQLKFKCDDGYRLLAEEPVYCTSNRTWSDSDVKCVAISCNSPKNPENGRVIFTSLRFRSQLKFECYDGYQLQDTDLVYCTLDGTWSRTDVRCVVSCSFQSLLLSLPKGVIPEAMDIRDAELISVPYNSTVRLKCNDFLKLKGNPFAKCSNSGIWEFGEVQCFLGCFLPEKSPESKLIITPLKDVFRFGETVQFSCPLELSLSTETERMMCLATGWSDDTLLPECLQTDHEY